MKLITTVSFHQKGVGLIEVMVSLLVLAIAVLGYVALQGQAIKVTDESLERSQSLVIMRNIGEKIRANPNAITTYETQLNAETNTKPSNLCGLDGGSTTTLCDSDALATAESYRIKEEIANYDFKVQIHPCPNTGGKKADNIMYSYCLLAAWGDTTPTIGEDADTDCLQAKGDNIGLYYSKATCMMMEL